MVVPGYTLNNRFTDGDHISIKRKINEFITYNHHGIYVGNDKVIHYTDESLSPLNAVIKETSLKKFIGNSDRKTLNILDYNIDEDSIYSGQPLDSTEVIKLAYSRLGEKQYDILKNNCEHLRITVRLVNQIHYR